MVSYKIQIMRFNPEEATIKMLIITTSSLTRACVLEEQPGIDFNSIECGEYSTEVAKDWITNPEQGALLNFAVSTDTYFDKLAVVCDYANYNKTVEKYSTLQVKERLAKFPYLLVTKIGDKYSNNKSSSRGDNEMEARLQALLNQ